MGSAKKNYFAWKYINVIFDTHENLIFLVIWRQHVVCQSRFSQHFMCVFNFIFIFYIIWSTELLLRLSFLFIKHLCFIDFLLSSGLFNSLQVSVLSSNLQKCVYFNVILPCQCELNLGSLTRDMKIGQKKENKDDWMWRHGLNNYGENIILFNYRRILLAFLNIKYPFLTSIL